MPDADGTFGKLPFPDESLGHGWPVVPDEPLEPDELDGPVDPDDPVPPWRARVRTCGVAGVELVEVW